MIGLYGAGPKRERRYLNSDFRTVRPARVVAVPTGCLAYWIERTGLGVALRFIEPAVLRTGCIARRTGLGKNPRMKLIAIPFLSSASQGKSRRGSVTKRGTVLGMEVAGTRGGRVARASASGPDADEGDPPAA